MYLRDAKQLVEIAQGKLVQREFEHTKHLIAEGRLGVGARAVDDIDDPCSQGR